MINPLKVATAGYLKRTTKAVLIIAVAGYLNFGGTPAPPVPTPSGGGGGGRGIGYHRRTEKSYEKQREEEDEKNEERFLIEFLKRATDIINNQ